MREFFLVRFARAWLARHPEILRYAATGLMNTLVNAAVFNLLIFATGVSRGPWVLVFSLVSFVITVIHSFFWNKHWVFKNDTREAARQLTRFFAITTTTALLNTGLIHLIVNVIGPPPGVNGVLWANVALALTIPVSFLCNFFGFKLLVFSKIKDSN